MKKKGHRPITKVKNPEPKMDDPDWIIWAAWADRITFEEIYERTGLTEAQVIARMRSALKASSFKRWRKRVHQKVSIKHRTRFVAERARTRRVSRSQLLSQIDTLES